VETLLWLLLIAAVVLLPAPLAVGFGIVAIVRQKVRVSRRRVLTGDNAILAGILCILVGIGYWFFLHFVGSGLP